MAKKMYEARSPFTLVAKKSTKVFQGGEWAKVPSVKLLFNQCICEVTDTFAQDHGFKDAQELHDTLIVKQPGFNVDFKEIPIDQESVAKLEASLKKNTPTVVTEARAIGK